MTLVGAPTPGTVEPADVGAKKRGPPTPNPTVNPEDNVGDEEPSHKRARQLSLYTYRI